MTITMPQKKNGVFLFLIPYTLSMWKSCILPNMAKKQIASGVVHRVPADVRKVLVAAPAVLAVWQDITPLARNEWICWIESVKKPETRSHHIARMRIELLAGKRRPCCWAGCPHR